MCSTAEKQSCPRSAGLAATGRKEPPGTAGTSLGRTVQQEWRRAGHGEPVRADGRGRKGIVELCAGRSRWNLGCKLNCKRWTKPAVQMGE